MNPRKNDYLNISIFDIERFMEDKGWSQREHPNHKIKLYVGPENDNGKPIELFLPNGTSFLDYSSRIEDTIKVLSIVHNIDPEKILEIITTVSHDVLLLRIPDTGLYNNSISLSYAFKNISALRKLFVFSASSEKRSLPFFDRPLSIGEAHADLCQFGHTFQGSFGLTINSPIISDYSQLNFFNQYEEIPFERRVLERIVRGLNLLDQSVLEDDGDILVNNFDIGLNSRMCESLMELSDKTESILELFINWSEKINLSDDLRNKTKWELNESTYKVLEYAKEELSKIEPFKETVVGKIVTLHASKSPLSDENFKRHAIVEHEYEGKKINVKLELDKNGYQVAYDAHGKGLPIKVVGEIFRKGNNWRIVDFENISIVHN
jgi:hypothetical protein